MNQTTFKKLLNAKRFIAQNFNRGFNLDEISRNVGMSKFHLARNFKDAFGETMHQFHARLRISKATKWICKSEFEISDIAWSLGFPDLSTFSKFFKKDLNICPRKFKKYYKKDNALFLNELYKNAKESIFATSNEDFFPFWESKFGDQILQSHMESSAAVTRAFIFKNHKEISVRHVEVLKRQLQAGIRVKLFFTEENEKLHEQMELLQGFAIIDGKMAGITKSFDDADFKSNWFFKSPTVLQNLNETRIAIENSSILFSEFNLLRNLHLETAYKYAANY